MERRVAKPLTEKEIFEYILKIGEKFPTRDGVVTACIVRGGRILVAAPSIEAGVVIHAEHNVLGYMDQLAAPILPEDILYTTLEPCTGRFDASRGIQDCTSIILSSGLRTIVFGASDPIQSALTRMRFQAAGIELRQAQDPSIVERCRGLFNTTHKRYKV